MQLIRSIFKKSDKKELKLMKETTGEWTVKKGSRVLYIGAKDKCLIYMNHVE